MPAGALAGAAACLRLPPWASGSDDRDTCRSSCPDGGAGAARRNPCLPHRWAASAHQPSGACRGGTVRSFSSGQPCPKLRQKFSSSPPAASVRAGQRNHIPGLEARLIQRNGENRKPAAPESSRTGPVPQECPFATPRRPQARGSEAAAAASPMRAPAGAAISLAWALKLSEGARRRTAPRGSCAHSARQGFTRRTYRR
jgi:hypothetical protein